MYIGKASSSADKKGGLLVGLESDSPYRMNQTGHMHNAAAVAEEGSSTGGLKQDIQGEKYGGRTVDLSGLKNQEVVGILNKFNEHMEKLRSDESRKDEYKQFLTKLSGKRMSDKEMEDLMKVIMPAAQDEAADNHTERIQEMIRRARQRK